MSTKFGIRELDAIGFALDFKNSGDLLVPV
jgi:hypothetical protein